MILREYIQSLEDLAQEHGDLLHVKRLDSDGTRYVVTADKPAIDYLTHNGGEFFVNPLAPHSWRGEKVVRV